MWWAWRALVAGRGLTSHGSIHVWGGSSLNFHPPRGEVELAYALQGNPSGTLRVARTNPEFPMTLGVDGHLAVAGDAWVVGKLYVKGSVSPTDLQLTPQKRNTVPPLPMGSGSQSGQFLAR